MSFHGIVSRARKWMRVIASPSLDTEDPFSAEKVEEGLDTGAYVPAFLEHFFPGNYRVEVRPHERKLWGGMPSLPTYATEWLRMKATIAFSNANDQYTVVIGDGGWLKALSDIGLQFRNSRKMAKRLIELVRLSSMWAFRPAENPLRIKVVDYRGPETDVDGISAISRSIAIECVNSNRHAGRDWRRRQIRDIKSGKTAVVSLRILTPNGEIKGNALVVDDDQIIEHDIVTFGCNIKRELATNGWYWMTIDPSYGAIPVKSDDLTHSIYRGVKGLYDDQTMEWSLRQMLLHFFKDLQEGKRSEWMEKLANTSSKIIHDERAEKRYASNRGTVARIQIAVAKLAELGVPLTASQTLMFMSVNGLKAQLLGDNRTGQVWRDTSRHWFPVPWAYAAHVMTAEVLRVFGFDIPDTEEGFYHSPTHTFVVPGKFFAENFPNHGGPDLDDTIKVHVRNVRKEDGSIVLMAILLRNPNDFGEWSAIKISDFGPVFHQYGKTPPVVDLSELTSKVPQWTKLKSVLKVGTLPCVESPSPIGDVFSLEDEARARNVAAAFPAGVGATVIPKMIWYATVGGPIPELCAPNEDIIDALQQGLAGPEDVRLIQEWIDRTMGSLREQAPNLDAFWYHTRLPRPVAEQLDWEPGKVGDSSWVQLHIRREEKVREALGVMTSWLNAEISIPEVLSQIDWTDEEKTKMRSELVAIRSEMDRHRHLVNGKRSLDTNAWVKRFHELVEHSDKERGVASTDRKLLRLAYAALLAKTSDTGHNYDQWLYCFGSEYHWSPVDRFIQALQRHQAPDPGIS